MFLFQASIDEFVAAIIRSPVMRSLSTNLGNGETFLELCFTGQIDESQSSFHGKKSDLIDSRCNEALDMGVVRTSASCLLTEAIERSFDVTK